MGGTKWTCDVGCGNWGRSRVGQEESASSGLNHNAVQRCFEGGRGMGAFEPRPAHRSGSEISEGIAKHLHQFSKSDNNKYSD